MKKLHTAMKAIIVSGILASFPNSDAIGMETLPDTGIAKIIEKAGHDLAERIYPKASHTANLAQNSSNIPSSKKTPPDSNDYTEKERKERG